MTVAQPSRPVMNISDVPLVERGNGRSFAVKWGRVTPLLGLESLGCALHVVPPGKRAFPFHVMDGLGRLTPADYYDGEDA